MNRLIIKQFVLAMCLLSAVGMAAHDFEVDGIYYNIVNNEASVTFQGESYNQFEDEYAGEVIIPLTVNYNGKSLSVTSIGNLAFYACKNISRVIIPNSVVSIGNHAFAGCKTLSEIDLPNSVTEISRCAFNGCSSLESISIPNSITQIASSCFNGCRSLKRISIPNSVVVIGEMAFMGCSSLSRLSIPNSVTSIASYAFNGCESLTRIAIPSSVTSIGFGAFMQCSMVNDIIVESSNKVYDSRDNCNAIIETSSNSIIRGCKNSSIPNSVTSIAAYAFDSCIGLKSVIIPNHITSIGLGAFGFCDSISEIIVESGNTVYDSRDNCNAIIETSKNIVISGCNNTHIPNSVTEIASDAFAGCKGLTSITIPNSVSIIGDWSFSSCSALTSISIGKNVTSIGHNTFAYCNSIESLTCWATTPPSCYNSFEFSVFDSATLYVPCEALSKYKEAEEWKNFKIIEGIPDIFIVDGIYYKWISDTTVCVTYKDENYNSYNGGIVIPSSISHEGETYQVTEIGEYAFSFSRNLTSVSIPNSVTKIGDCAFQECSQLKNIVIPNSVVEVGNHAFDYAGLTNVNLGNSIKTIGENAFTGCQFTSLTLPQGLLSIGENAFSECSSMKSINLPGTLVSIGELAFDMCSSLSSITIPKSVTNIGREAFEECQSLISMKVQSGNEIYDSRNNCNAIIETATNTLIAGCKTSIIPNTVKAIGDYAFALCTGLSQVSIPSSVESIGNDAFIGCSNLSKVTIGVNVTSIGEYAFLDCEEITNLTCFASIPPSLFNMECFSDCVYDNAILYVPKGSLENYIFSESWSRFINIQELESINEKGDVNGDGEINIADVNAIIDIILSTPVRDKKLSKIMF